MYVRLVECRSLKYSNYNVLLPHLFFVLSSYMYKLAKKYVVFVDHLTNKPFDDSFQQLRGVIY